MEGRRADAYLFYKSQLDDILRDYMNINGDQYYIYGDAAYAMRPWLQIAYARRTATDEQRVFNTSMNKPRTAVEWSYGELKNTFTSQDIHRKLQVKKLPVGLLYIVILNRSRELFYLRNYRRSVILLIGWVQQSATTTDAIHLQTHAYYCVD